MLAAAPPLSGIPAAPPPGLPVDADSPLDLNLESIYEDRRTAAQHQPLIWQGRTLQPWSLWRRALHKRLMMSLAPVPKHLWGENAEAHAPDAMLFLWLAHHPIEPIVTLSSQPAALWVEVLTWAEKTIPHAQWPQALQLMLDTFDLARITEVNVRQEAAKSRLGEPPPCPAPKRPSSASSRRKGTAARKPSAGTPPSP